MTGSFLELLFGLGAVFYKEGRAFRTFKLLLAGAYTSRKGQKETLSRSGCLKIPAY
jgi:hypothetical protein